VNRDQSLVSATFKFIRHVLNAHDSIHTATLVGYL